MLRTARIFFVIFIPFFALSSCSPIETYKARRLVDKIVQAHGGREAFYHLRNACVDIQVRGEKTKPYFFNFYQEPTELPETRHYYLFALPFKLHDAENNFSRGPIKTLFNETYFTLTLRSQGQTHELYVDRNTYHLRFLKVEKDPLVNSDALIEFKYENVNGLWVAHERILYKNAKVLQREKITQIIFWCRPQ